MLPSPVATVRGYVAEKAVAGNDNWGWADTKLG